MYYNSMSTECSKSLDQRSMDSHIPAKLKRLKLQEEILIQSLKQLGVDNGKDCSEDLEFLEYNKKIYHSYNKIKDMFEDTKAKIYANDMLESIDIGEIKINILELDANIKVFKQYLQSEIKSLMVIEEDLTKQVNYDKNIKEIWKHSKIQTVTYNKIVPSPVKMIMSSPFKCLEVQQFQDFLAQYPNRYGGWNEYNHNIFKKLWHKYFQDSESDVSDNAIQTEKFDTFIEECHKNIHDVNRECVIIHSKWYIQYLNLKNRQQKAIDRWKNNRKALTELKGIRKGDFIKDHNGFNDYNESINKQERDLSSSSIKEISNKKVNMISSSDENANSSFSRNSRQYKNITSTYEKPTKQWIHRCSDVESQASFKSIANTKKLRIPDWRLGL